MTDVPETIVVTEDGHSLPVIEVLTGRGFITGKSGSGKSNTASVILEELLDANLPVLIVDTDGEYYGLKESYEILHVGADDSCDIAVGPEHADKLAELALSQNVPIILDVSGFLDQDVAKSIIRQVVQSLFKKEKKQKQPFLLLVEEIHEYLPESGGLDDLGEVLIQVAKRGRKHGLGLAGISQRPAAVEKDFITQCDWLVWHRLTWDNDTKVVKQVLGGDAAETVQDLEDGEALLVTDWDGEVKQVQFRRKRTFDAGATPGLDDFERPDLKSVGSDLVDELQEISGQSTASSEDVAALQETVEAKQERIVELEAQIEELETELEQSRENARATAREAAEAKQKLSETDDEADPPVTSIEARPYPASVRERTVGPEPDEYDPLWEVNQLFVHLFYALRRRTLGWLRALGKSTETIAAADWGNGVGDTLRRDAAVRRAVITLTTAVGLLAGLVALGVLVVP